MFETLCTKLLKSSVYFIPIAHLTLDCLHFK